MNAISSFTFHEKHNVRVQLINGEPYFCLRDICTVLSVDARSSSKFGLDVKGMEKLSTPSKGGNQNLNYVNEPNLYRVIFRSNKPEAKQFQDWVFNEVLPTIRKTGHYSAPLVEPIRKTITIEQQAALHQLVAKRTAKHPELKAAIWAKHNHHFNIPRYNELLAIHFDDAVRYITNLKLPHGSTDQSQEQLKPIAANSHPREKHWVDVIESIRPRALAYLFDLRTQVHSLGGQVHDWKFEDSDAIQTLLSHFLMNKQLVICLDSEKNLKLIDIK